MLGTSHAASADASAMSLGVLLRTSDCITLFWLRLALVEVSFRCHCIVGDFSRVGWITCTGGNGSPLRSFKAAKLQGIDIRHAKVRQG